MRMSINALVLGSIVALSMAPAAHAEKPIQLEFNNWLASTAAVSVGAFEPWKKLVEEKTNGRVKVNLYHGGVLGGSRSVLDDVRGGVYHVGYSIPTYYYDTPYCQLLVGELPFALPGSKVGAKVMTAYAQKYSQDIFDKLGVKNMGVGVSDPYVIISTKPVRTFDDMKGLRMRAPGKTWVPIAKEWNAVPTPMQPEDAYTALDRGTIDAMHYSLAGALGWKYHEVAPYVTRLNTPTIVVNMIMNKDFYESLPDDLKKLFDEELDPALIDLIATVYEEGVVTSTQKMEAVFKSKGKGEFITLSDEERARFIAPTKQAWDDWVAEADKRGMDGEKMLSNFKSILKENGVTPPF